MTMRAVLVVGACWLFGHVGNVSADDVDWQATRDQVDRMLQARWDEAGIEPSPPADDATFLRRASLDLTGRIPAVGEVRAFLENVDSDKRAGLIDRLLSKPSHAAHLTIVWRDVMLPQNSNARLFGQAGQFDNWLRGHFADNTSYNEMVEDLLTATGQINQTGPILYYSALEAKPEELAASTSRIFLGVQIECAQCHDHPFDHWTQKDFWGYAAFFARLTRPQGQQNFVAQLADQPEGEVTLPDTEEVVAPQFLGRIAAPPVEGLTRRKQLAQWLTAADNPYFAKATVNRIWALLFGYGLVHPVDDFGEHNPCSHPELLELLSRDFVDHGFDVRRMFRILANTRAYQLSSRVTADDPAPSPHLFSRMAVKSLSAEQIYDCLAEATRRRESANANGQFTPFGNRFNQARQAFLAKFTAPTQEATEFQAGIPQALTMMNSTLIDQATDVAQSDILVALTDAPFLNDAQRVEVLFLAALSRYPTDDERERFVEYVESGGVTSDTKRALSDVLWALLNSTEFILNH